MNWCSSRVTGRCGAVLFFCFSFVRIDLSIFSVVFVLSCCSRREYDQHVVFSRRRYIHRRWCELPALERKVAVAVCVLQKKGEALPVNMCPCGLCVVIHLFFPPQLFFVSPLFAHLCRCFSRRSFFCVLVSEAVTDRELIATSAAPHRFLCTCW
jgi:hypothetical protein